MYIWSALRQGITPEVNAIGSCVIFASIVIVALAVSLISNDKVQNA
jgi:ABC-type spermidine/putrescine transport system permease subunit II